MKDLKDINSYKKYEKSWIILIFVIIIAVIFFVFDYFSTFNPDKGKICYNQSDCEKHGQLFCYFIENKSGKSIGKCGFKVGCHYVINNEGNISEVCVEQV